MFLIISIVFCGIIWWVFIREKENPLDKLPGPPKKPFIGNALQLMTINPDDYLNEMVNFKAKYGDRFVIKFLRTRELHISNPDDIEVILSHSKNISKSFSYEFLKPWLRTGLLTSTGSKWHNRRKILTSTFHFNILKSYHVTMEEQSRNLTSRLKEYEGSYVDVLPVISDYTLYTICETAMGTQLHSDKSSSSLEYKKAIMAMGNLMISRLTRVWLHFDFIFNRTIQGNYLKKCLETLDTFGGNVIRERKTNINSNGTEEVAERNSKKRLAFLDFLILAESKGDIDFEGIREEVNTIMFEGHDTIAIGLTFCLLALADHEDVQERIYKECQCIFTKCGGKPSLSDFSEMRYLEAVIKESLRLYPSVPLIGRLIDEDFMMGDLFVQKGTAITLHLFSLHRREDLFPDPELFRPERFLQGKLKHPFAFVPFSAGLRNCIGQRFAMLEMKTALCEICRNFKLEPKVKGWRPPLAAFMVLTPLEPIHIKFIPRL